MSDDWVFDFALQFLESDKFDAAVMDFVDEKCDVFDAEDENKFIYSDIHRDFRDHIEALITSNLGELGITPQMFYESCERGRHHRDINRAVFERLLSMEDFDTFKRIMVKRNMELQIEALGGGDLGAGHSPMHTPAKNRKAKIMTTIDSPFTEAEEKSQLEEALAASLRTGPPPEASLGPGLGLGLGAHDAALQSTLKDSLAEMELLHRQEQLEQLELEKAIALSLAIEEGRLQALREEVKREGESRAGGAESKGRDDKGGGRKERDPDWEAPPRDDGGAKAQAHDFEFKREEKEPSPSMQAPSSSSSSSSSSLAAPSSSSSSSSSSNPRQEPARQASRDETSGSSSHDAPSSSSSSSSAARDAPSATRDADPAALDDRAEAKLSAPLKPAKPPRSGGTALGAGPSSAGELKPILGMGLGSKPLPPIAMGANLSLPAQLPSMSTINALSDELDEKRKQASEDRRLQQTQLAEQRAKEDALRRSTMNPEEAEQRARLMREQRDKLLAMKRAERDRKVAEEEERRREIQALLDDEDFAAQEGRAFVARQQAGDKAGDARDPRREAEVTAALEEERRNSMRQALARRMKLELSEAKGVPDDRMAELEAKLALAEKMREENRQRERAKKSKGH